MSARTALRAATAADHDRVDAIFGRFSLGDEADYRRFLKAQAGAFLTAEAALDRAGAECVVPDWPQRRRAPLLRQDLAALGEAAPTIDALPPLDGEAAILGTAYVLEGSRLGGSLLRKSVADGLPHAFLSGPQEPGAWRNFIALLDQRLDTPEKIDTAAAAACATFALFERSAQSVLENAHG